MKRTIAMLTVLCAGAGALYATVASAAPEATPKNVTVNMTEYKFRLLPRTTYKVGVPYVFKTVNKGQLIHNFDIQRVKASRIIGGGKTATIRVVFKRSGRYQYVCDVPRHAEQGMVGSLTVRT